jgi:hypothetical protein
MRRNILPLIADYKKTFLYCSDPGSLFVMEPLRGFLESEGINCQWVFSGWSMDNRKDLDFIPLEAFKDMLINAESDSFCLLIGVQIKFENTCGIIDFCRANKVRSIVVIDYWKSNHMINFRHPECDTIHLPDNICIMDETARDELIREMLSCGIPESYGKNIAIIGHPGIEKNAETIKSMNRKLIAATRKRLDIGCKRATLLALNPAEEDFGYDENGKPRLGYDEYDLMDYFFNEFDLRGARVLVKPHPRQDAVKVEKYISENFGEKNLDWIMTGDESLEDLIAVSDEVVGSTSTVLLVALFAGKSIKSIQPNRSEFGALWTNHYIEENRVV